MTLEEDVFKFEFFGVRDAKLFYATVGGILSKLCFTTHFEHYFGVKGDFIIVRKNFWDFRKLFSSKGTFKDLNFRQVFKGIDGSEVKAMTGYPDVNAFKKGIFSYYAIGCTSNLGSKLPLLERANVPNLDKWRVTNEDFDHGFLTKIGSHYFFTLLSLYKVAEESKPVLRPHYAYQS